MLRFTPRRSRFIAEYARSEAVHGPIAVRCPDAPADFLFLLSLLSPVLAEAQAKSPGALTATTTDDSAAVHAALSKVAPSLVRIHVVSIDHQEGRELKRQAAGSGTIITPEGHVVTNHHVAGRTKSIVCTLSSREEIPAELVGTDPLSDIAVLKLKPPMPRTFPTASFGTARNRCASAIACWRSEARSRCRSR